MLLALLVLGGFSVLFMLAFNEDPADSKFTPEAIILSQEKEIVALQAAISQRQTDLAPLPQRKEVARMLEDTQRKLRISGERMTAVQEELTGLASQLPALEDEFAGYQDTYRETARAGAKGEQLGTLTTLKGRTYQKAVIREVNPMGVRITYDDGAGGTSIPYEELPAAMQDRFQFDPVQRDEFLAREATASAAYHQAVKNSLKDKQQEKSAVRANAEQQRRENAIRAIAVKSARIAALDAELIRLEGDLRLEMTKKLRNTNAIKSTMADKDRERTELRREVAELNASL